LLFFNGKINCNGKCLSLHDELPKDFSYEPELFPAVMFRRHGMHFICHLSGKTMITGIKRSSNLGDIYNVL
jgi:TATA-box binding protein (TBP) (component of TFIID and TFIIIB)